MPTAGTAVCLFLDHLGSCGPSPRVGGRSRGVQPWMRARCADSCCTAGQHAYHVQACNLLLFVLLVLLVLFVLFVLFVLSVSPPGPWVQVRSASTTTQRQVQARQQRSVQFCRGSRQLGSLRVEYAVLDTQNTVVATLEGNGGIGARSAVSPSPKSTLGS
ncbi:hypothetical protein J1614_002066 [Plenodomus biglobosus]|nr:hypothetical protein J1614_002066 [Plenodomus biglobosus]